MPDGIRFPDDMQGVGSPLNDNDKVLISDSQDAKKAKWWSLAIIKEWLTTLFAKLDASNVIDAHLTEWQTQLDIALFKSKISSAVSNTDVYTLDENGVYETDNTTANIPLTNKIGILNIIKSDTDKYLTYRTWNNDVMEYWSNKFDGTNWSSWVNLLETVGAQNWIDFISQGTAPPEQFGRMYYCGVTKSYSAYTHITGVQPYRFGRTLRSSVINNTASIISKGSICKIVGLSGVNPVVEMASAMILKDVQTTVGMAMHDIPPNGGEGILAVFDSLIGIDTSGMTTNDLIYLSDTVIGGFTNIKPKRPNYSLPVGFVSIVGVSGAIGLRFGSYSGSDTSTNLEGILNGIVTDVPNIDISVSGGIIYADVTNENNPTKELPFLLDDIRYNLNTLTNSGASGAARVIIPPGSSSILKQTSLVYIYLNGSVPTLGASTSEPNVPYSPIAYLTVFDAARTLSDGKPFGYRRHNNDIDRHDGVHDGSFGLQLETLTAIRLKLGSNWLNGQDATTTVNNTNIKLALSAGNGMQFRKASLPIFDGNKYLIYNNNANAVTYQDSINLTDITQTASGVSLLSNNSFYTIRVFYQLNSNGIGNNVIATRPLGKYSTLAEAISDPLNYTVSMNDTDIEEIIYPLYDLVISRTGSGGTTISLGLLRDLRSKLAGSIGGAGAKGGGTDDKVRISAADTTNDYLQPKLSITNGLTAAIVNPGANEQLSVKLGGAMTANTTLSGAFTLAISQGKLAIGKATASTALDVEGAGTFSGAVTSEGNIINVIGGDAITIDTASDLTSMIRIKKNGVELGSLYALSGSNDFNIRNPFATGGLNFQTGGTSTKLSITNTGVATFSSTVAATQFIAQNSTDDAKAYLGNIAGSGGFLSGFSADGSQGFLIRSYVTSGTQAYFTKGNIAIGKTAAGNARLDILGTGQDGINIDTASDLTSMIRIKKNGVELGSLYALSGSNDFNIRNPFATGGLNFQTGGTSTKLSITNTGAATFSNTVTATDFIQGSDERLKENIKLVNQDIDSVEIKQYNFISDETKRLRIGVIAQDVEEVAPYMVHTDKEGMKSVSNIDFLFAKVASLEKRIKELEGGK